MLLLIQKQSEYGDVNKKRESLILEGKSLELPKWEITFQDCQLNTCKDLNVGPISIELPNPSQIQSLLKSSHQHANIAKLVHRFSPEEQSWLVPFGDTYVTFVIATNAQKQTLLKVGENRIRSANSGNHLVATYRASELSRAGEVELLYAIDNLDWFGPADLPPAILSESSATEFLALRERQIASANLYRQLYIGFPFLIAAIALVLDHSLAFTLLALFGLSQALKSFLYFGLDNGVFQFEDISTIIYASTGLGFALAILLALELARIQVFNVVSKIGFAIASAFAVVLTKTYGPNFVVSSDAWIDSLASSGGLIICIIGIAINWSRHQKANHLGQKSNLKTHLEPPSRLITIRLIITGSGFFIHGWANIRDLMLLENSGFKDFLDWRHNMLYAALVSAALLEVGSTSRKMLRYAQSLVQKALLERELAIGREVQQRMLPPSRGQSGDWSWRSFYIPASALAGDWYDVRVIQFATGERVLLCCLADVTGHGVGAALATSVLSSHWTLWCESVAQDEFPNNLDNFGQLLASAPDHINRGLLALRNNENCTAIMTALVQGIDEIFIVCAGHPGALIVQDHDFRYVSSRGPRLGVESDQFEWKCERAPFSADDVALLYSDGLVPPGKTVSSWLGGIKRQIRQSKETSIIKSIASQVVSNRRAFRKDQSLEDDITLLGFGLTKENHEGLIKDHRKVS